MLVIRGGHVLTMDPALGDIPGGDLVVDGGRIVAVGPSADGGPAVGGEPGGPAVGGEPGGPAVGGGPAVDVRGAEVLDARGMIVAPGLVDTHWHLWNTLLRGLSGSGPGYFPACARFGPAFGPADLAAGTRLACAEAIYSGVTTVHDWCHNVRGPAWAEAGVTALAAAGLRARFSYGYAAGQPNGQPMDLAGLAAMDRGWDSRGGLLTLGMAWRGPGGSNPAIRVAPAIYRQEIDTARGLGLPVTVHACGPPAAAGQIAALAAGGLLGPDLQVVHATCASPAELDQLAAAGGPVSLSPFSELLVGYGPPQTSALLAAGVPVGLSADTTALTGNADMFSIMKLTQGLVNGAAREEFAMTARGALALGTIDGARSLGLGAVTGSLTVGKRADVIVVAADEPNLGVLTDPAQLLVTAAQPANVRHVLADGRFLKRDGDVVAMDVARVTADARAALARVRAAAA